VDISIFIPVYKESNQLSSILNELESQEVTKEIFVTADEPTDKFAQQLKQIRSADVKVCINKARVGKANACNDAAKVSTGKVLLFLDADIQLNKDTDFLKKIIMELGHADIVDIKKRVKKDKSFLSRMTYYEYFSYNVSAWLSSRLMHKCPAVNGAAFAIKRETFERIGGFHRVVDEDIDLATRAFLQDSSFSYAEDVEVRNVVYGDWHRWYKQRQRWSISQARWTLDWYQELIKKFFKKPQVFLPSLFFLYPSIVAFLISVTMPSLWMYNSMLVFSIFLSARFNIMLPVFLVSLTTANLLKVVAISLAGFGISAATFYGFSRRLGFREMKLHELFAYYFFYSNVWLALQVAGYFHVIVLRQKTGPDWKV
jgi:biofilm PGA synthesis N-glycosyltransferase PgaC